MVGAAILMVFTVIVSLFSLPMAQESPSPLPIHMPYDATISQAETTLALLWEVETELSRIRDMSPSLSQYGLKRLWLSLADIRMWSINDVDSRSGV